MLHPVIFLHFHQYEICYSNSCFFFLNVWLRVFNISEQLSKLSFPMLLKINSMILSKIHFPVDVTDHGNKTWVKPIFNQCVRFSEACFPFQNMPMNINILFLTHNSEDWVHVHVSRHLVIDVINPMISLPFVRQTSENKHG